MKKHLCAVEYEFTQKMYTDIEYSSIMRKN